MKWKTFWLILLIALGYFGIFWTMNLADMRLEFALDDNSLEAVKRMENISNNMIDLSCQSINKCVPTQTQGLWCQIKEVDGG